MFIRQTVGNYDILGIQRESAFLDIYLALDLKSQQKVLFWKLFPKNQVSDTFLAEFREIATKICNLDHPNLLRVHDWGIEQGCAYLVTPEISGKLLSGCINDVRGEREAANICQQICCGLMALHEHGLLAGAISPETVIINDNGSILLYQYGITEIVNAEIHRSAPEKLLSYGIGNPSYLAPEIIAGRSPSRYTDQYALGAIMYTLLNQEAPFKSTYPSEVAINNILAPLGWPEYAGRTLTRSAVNFVLKCMTRQPNQRFHDLADANRVLQSIKEGKRISISLTRDQHRNAPKTPAGSRFWSITAIILFLAAGITAWWLLNFSSLQLPRSEYPVIQETIGATVSSPDITATLSARMPTTTVTQVIATSTAKAVPTKANVDLVEPVNMVVRTAPLLMGEAPPQAGDVITLSNFSMLHEQTRLGKGRLNHAAYSSDGKMMAIASSAGVFLFRNSAMIKFLDPQDEATAVQFSIDDQTLAVGLRKGGIQFWDTNTYQQLDFEFSGEPHTAAISRLLYSPNRRHLISASYDQYIKIWDITTKTLERSIHAHPKAIKDIAITSDAAQLVSASLDPVVMLWNLEDGSKKREFRHTGPVLSVDISSDGSYIAAGSLDGNLRQWYTIDGRERSNPLNLGRAIYSLYYNENDQELYLGLDEGKQLQLDANYQPNKFGNVRIETFGPAPEKPYGELGATFEFSTFMLINPNSNSPVQISWDSNIKNQSASIPGMDYNKFSYLRFSPDSGHLAIGGNLPGVTIWNVYDNTQVYDGNAWIPPGNPFSLSSNKLALVTKKIIPAKNRYEKAQVAEYLDLYSTDNLTKVNNLSDFIRNSSVQFVMDDRLLVSTSRTRSKFWDIASNQETRLVEANDYGCQVTHSANNGQVFTVFSAIGVMTEWDDLSIGVCKINTRFENRLAALAPNREWVAYINTSKQLEKISIVNSTTAWRTEKPVAYTAMAISPDSSLLVTGAEDGTLSFWDPDTGELMMGSLNAHFGSVLSIAFSPDGKLLATGSADGTVRIWTTSNNP